MLLSISHSTPVDRRCPRGAMFLDMFVHDTFRQHSNLVKFTNELDQTETLPFGLLRHTIFVPVEIEYAGCSGRLPNGGILR